MACGSKEFEPPFPFPQGGKPGREGAPHADARCAPANSAGTHRCRRLPPQEGCRPLVHPPYAQHGISAITEPGLQGRFIEIRPNERSRETFTQNS